MTLFDPDFGEKWKSMTDMERLEALIDDAFIAACNRSLIKSCLDRLKQRLAEKQGAVFSEKDSLQLYFWLQETFGKECPDLWLASGLGVAITVLKTKLREQPEPESGEPK